MSNTCNADLVLNNKAYKAAYVTVRGELVSAVLESTNADDAWHYKLRVDALDEIQAEMEAALRRGE